MSEKNGEAKEVDLTVNDAISEGIRLGLATSLGETGFNSSDDNERRNLYDVFGWPKDDLTGWDEDNWVALYLRNAYAKVVNDKPAFTTWRDDPHIHEDEVTPDDEHTQFEQEVHRLARSNRIWSYSERVDRAAGLGQHGLLLLGYSDISDADDWSEEASGLNGLDDLTQLKPILETQIEDIDFGGPDSDRWGQPESYTLDLSDDIDEETEDDPLTAINVHHSRVVDVPARPLLDDETFARPRVEPVLNNILDIEKTLGSAAEAAYRAADYGLHINTDPTEVDLSDGADELRNELQRYEQDLQRYIRTQGTEVNRLGGDIQDPSGIIENNLDAISAETGIPKRELRGNQQGEQSGAEQDEKSYFGMIAERRKRYANPHIIRPLLETLQSVGILSDTPNGFVITWPDLSQLDEETQSTIESNRASVVQAVPGIAGETAIQYVKNGSDTLPEAETDQVANIDETDAHDVQTFVESYVSNQQERIPPETAAENARRGLECVEEVDTDAGKAQGRDTARLIIDAVENNEPISEDMIGEIASFDRHREQGNHEVAPEFEGSPCEDNGWVSWKLWGGSAGVDWAQELNDKLDED